MGYVCLLRIHLHFPDNGSLKGKRKELQAVKAQLQRRFGAAVAETGHHDLWQRSELSAALVAREVGALDGEASRLARWVEGRYPEGARVERTLLSTEDVLGGR